MTLVIPYGIRLAGDEGRVETVPVAYIRVRYGAFEIPGIFVVDSGATTTLLPASDADELGISLKKGGERVAIQGATGHVLMGCRHRVDMVIDNFFLHAVPVIFARAKNIPRVLGREGVFSRFGILFDEARRRTALLDAHKERKAIDGLLS
ncbi:MAG: retropepsin-like aspartic protease [bacterium]|nr:retropepsin-like aspartic protease [bacterium]MDZ4299953.1 retropepsin-like aspartic protease [Candidatus Sungbacteria bacterium]